MSAHTALVAQYLFNEVTLGTRMHLTPLTAFDFGVVENVINSNNGPDFGFHFGITHDVQRRR